MLFIRIIFEDQIDPIYCTLKEVTKSLPMLDYCYPYSRRPRTEMSTVSGTILFDENNFNKLNNLGYTHSSGIKFCLLSDKLKTYFKECIINRILTYSVPLSTRGEIDFQVLEVGERSIPIEGDCEVRYTTQCYHNHNVVVGYYSNPETNPCRQPADSIDVITYSSYSGIRSNVS